MDTFILFIGTVVAWLGLEFSRVLRGKQSISGQIWQVYQSWPALGWLSGLLVGTIGSHLFFSQCGP